MTFVNFSRYNPDPEAWIRDFLHGTSTVDTTEFTEWNLLRFKDDGTEQRAGAAETPSAALTRHAFVATGFINAHKKKLGYTSKTPFKFGTSGAWVNRGWRLAAPARGQDYTWCFTELIISAHVRPYRCVRNIYSHCRVPVAFYTLNTHMDGTYEMLDSVDWHAPIPLAMFLAWSAMIRYNSSYRGEKRSPMADQEVLDFMMTTPYEWRALP